MVSMFLIYGCGNEGAMTITPGDGGSAAVSAGGGAGTVEETVITDSSEEATAAQASAEEEVTGGPPATAFTQLKEITMIAKKWDFEPSTITVNLGDEVIIKVTSIDVDHGFALPEFGVNEFLTPNKEVEVKFVADKKGEFGFFCSVPCGRGHGGMRGKLIVE
jgi:cytochrome c oxidase subunit II